MGAWKDVGLTFSCRGPWRPEPKAKPELYINLPKGLVVGNQAMYNMICFT